VALVLVNTRIKRKISSSLVFRYKEILLHYFIPLKFRPISELVSRYKLHLFFVDRNTVYNSNQDSPCIEL